jgi:hypothetical protein
MEVSAVDKEPMAAMRDRDRAHQEAMRLPLSSLAEKLQDVLGQQLTAYAVGLKDPRMIGKYARGAVKKPGHSTEDRLRRLYVITQILSTRETAETVRAWMIGANPLLEHRAPVELLHEENEVSVEKAAGATAPPRPTVSTERYRPVLDAAESFVAAA